jgi:hypothetical protein
MYTGLLTATMPIRELENFPYRKNTEYVCAYWRKKRYPLRLTISQIKLMHVRGSHASPNDRQTVAYVEQVNDWK